MQFIKLALGHWGICPICLVGSPALGPLKSSVTEASTDIKQGAILKINTRCRLHL